MPPLTPADAHEFVAISCAVLGVGELADRIRLTFHPRFTARMGDARYDPATTTGRIRLSASLWPKATPEQQAETVGHEACHVVAAFLHGPRQGHGPAWRALMTKCGYPGASRCHTVDAEAIVTRRLARWREIACGCPNRQLISPVAVSRLRSGRTAVCRRLSAPSTRPARRRSVGLPDSRR